MTERRGETTSRGYSYTPCDFCETASRGYRSFYTPCCECVLQSAKSAIISQEYSLAAACEYSLAAASMDPLLYESNDVSAFLALILGRRVRMHVHACVLSVPSLDRTHAVNSNLQFHLVCWAPCMSHNSIMFERMLASAQHLHNRRPSACAAGL